MAIVPYRVPDPQKDRTFRVEAHRSERGIALTISDDQRGTQLSIELIEPKMLLVYRALGQALAESKL